VEIAAENVDADFTVGTGSARSQAFYFATPPTLSYGTAYYVGIEAGGGSNFALHGYQLAASGDQAAFPGGSGFYLATYASSAWTEDQTVRPLMTLVLGDSTGSSGGGGPLIGGRLAL